MWERKASTSPPATSLPLQRTIVTRPTSRVSRDSFISPPAIKRIALSTETACKRKPLIHGSGRSRLQQNLLIIVGSDDLEKIAQGSVILLLQKQKVQAKFPREMQHGISLLNLHAVGDDMGILRLRRRDALNFPACRQFDGHIIHFLVRVIDVDRVDAVLMFEYVFFGSRKDSCRNHRVLACTRRPVWNGDIEFSDQRCLRVAPIRLVS